jgi:acetyl esterase/lipase
MIVRAMIAAGLMALLAGCTSGAAESALPQETGVRLAVQSAPYGEGPRRSLDVYAPAQARGLPVIVFFYGGAWQFGEKARMAFVGEALAAEGFVVVVPDYRVYPEVRFPGFIEDAAASIKWTADNIARYGGDPARIVLAGHSAGAHIAALVALDPSYAAAAGYDHGAVRGVIGISGPYYHPAQFRDERLCEIFCSAPDWSTVEPMHFVSSDDPPILLLVGDQDAAVPPIAPFVEAAEHAGARVEAHIYPGVDHGGTLMALLPDRRESAPTLADVTAFARRVTAN